MGDKLVVIDVRTPEEFQEGHVPKSINIPLNEIPDRVDEIKSMDGRIILCCAVGGRSEQAMLFLKGQGLDCENGGGWEEVQSNLGF